MLSELKCAFSVVLPFNIEGNHEKLMLALKIIKDSDKLLWLSRFREMPWLYNSVLLQILLSRLAILCWFITSPSNASINGLNNLYVSLDKHLAHLNLQDCSLHQEPQHCLKNSIKKDVTEIRHCFPQHAKVSQTPIMLHTECFFGLLKLAKCSKIPIKGLTPYIKGLLYSQSILF